MSGECQTKNTKNYEDEEKEQPIIALDEGNNDIIIYMIQSNEL